MITLEAATATFFLTGTALVNNPLNCVAGRLGIATIAYNRQTATTRAITSITDTAGNVWLDSGYYGVIGVPSSEEALFLWYCPNMLANASNVLTVNVSADLGGEYCIITISTWTDVMAASPLDTGANDYNNDPLDPINSDPITTTQADELILGSIWSGTGAVPSLPSGMTYLYADTYTRVAYEVVSSIQVAKSYQTNISFPSYTMFMIVTFKQAAAVVTGTPFFTTVGAKRI